MHCKTRYPSSFLPLLTRYLGVSGIKRHRRVYIAVIQIGITALSTYDSEGSIQTDISEILQMLPVKTDCKSHTMLQLLSLHYTSAELTLCVPS